MKQEEKELLTKDISARSPYGVKALYYDYIEKKEAFGIIDVIYIDYNDSLEDCSVGIGYLKLELSEIKPYLFPMSSMTDFQREEYESLCIKVTSECADISGFFYTKDDYYDTIESIDYLYKNHIDVRGLISIGLAIDATGLGIY